MYEFKKIYTIDFSNVTYYMEIHPIIREALDFPEYYGGSLDALWDCLTDMLGRPIHIRIIGLDVLEKKFGDTAAKLIDILKDLKASENGLFAHEISIEVV